MILPVLIASPLIDLTCIYYISPLIDLTCIYCTPSTLIVDLTCMYRPSPTNWSYLYVMHPPPKLIHLTCTYCTATIHILWYISLSDMYNDDRLCSSNRYKPCWKIKQVSLHTSKRIAIIYSTVASYACINILHSTMTSYIFFIPFRTFFSELSEKNSGQFYIVMWRHICIYII